MSTPNDTFPLDPKQDKSWPAPKLVVVGAVSLLAALVIIYTAATTLGEQPNQFHHLEQPF